MEDTCSTRMIMLSAMYENGGNVLHRHLDGHPELHVYPFESQLGNELCTDYLTTLFPAKYRYPEFPTSVSTDDAYELFFDEEMKTRLRAPKVSKFRDVPLDLDENDRRAAFRRLMATRPPRRGFKVASFFEATFAAWKDAKRTGKETCYVGYSPLIAFDAEPYLHDFPAGHMIHVVRNPWSGFADTIKRPYPRSLDRYTWTWAMVQHRALVYRRKYPDRFHVVRFEDLVADPDKAMRSLVSRIGIAFDRQLLLPSWNGIELRDVRPWGTIATPTADANIATMNELDGDQMEAIAELSSVMLPLFGYENFLATHRSR